jgi:hypothetical protein
MNLLDARWGFGLVQGRGETILTDTFRRLTTPLLGYDTQTFNNI